MKEAGKILYLGLLTISGAVAASLISLFFTGNAAALSENSLLSLQMISSILIFLLPSILFLYKYRDTLMGDEEFFKFSYPTLMAVLFLIIFIRPLISWFDSFLSFEPEYFQGSMNYLREMAEKINEQVIKLAYSETPLDLTYRLIVIALVPAVAEELFFRGIIQNILIKSTANVHLSIFVSSFVFAAVHMNIINFFAIFMLGLVLGYVYRLTGNLFYSVIAHLVNNGSIVLMMYQNKDISYGESSEVSFSILLISVILSALSFYYLTEKKRFENI